MKAIYPGFPNPSWLCFIGIHRQKRQHPGIDSFDQCGRCGHSWRR